MTLINDYQEMRIKKLIILVFELRCTVSLQSYYEYRNSAISTRP